MESFDRRIVGIVFNTSFINQIDFTKTIEANTSDLVISQDGMTSVRWDIDMVGEIPTFVNNIYEYHGPFTRIELESIKKLDFWIWSE